MPDRTYSDDEVREILRRAVEKSAAPGAGLSRNELIAVARDAGIEPGAVDQAIGTFEWDREVTEEALALRRAGRRKLVSSALTWVIVVAAVWFLSGFALPGWVWWPMGVWAVLLALQVKGVLLGSVESERPRAERNVEQRRRRQRRLPRQVRAPSPEELEHASGAEDAAEAPAKKGRRTS